MYMLEEIASKIVYKDKEAEIKEKEVRHWMKQSLFKTQVRILRVF